MDLIERLREYASTRKGELAELITEAADALERQPCDDDPRADVYYLAEKIGIHRLYALVVALRGEPELCEDTISRQAVLKAIDEYERLSAVSQTVRNMTSLREIVQWVPAAQPQITHCAECIHWKHSDVRKNYCEVFDWMNTAEDFCSFAERKDTE